MNKQEEKKGNTKLIVGTTIGVAATLTTAYMAASYYFFNRIFDKKSVPTSDIREGSSFFNSYKKYKDWLDNSLVDDLYLTSFDDLKLHAKAIILDYKNPNWIINVPGYGGSATSFMDPIYNFSNMGFNVLSLDQRSFGESEGKYNTMGYLEHYDIYNWIKYLVEEYPNCNIVLYGVSTGASAVMNTTGEKLPDNVKCAISDCGFSSIENIINYQVKQSFNIPGKIFTFGINVYCKSFAKFDLKKGNCLNALSMSSTPTMFIHGERDSSVPYEMVFENYYSCKAEKELYTVQDAKHGTCYKNKNYFNRIEKFIYHYIKK